VERDREAGDSREQECERWREGLVGVKEGREKRRVEKEERSREGRIERDREKGRARERSEMGRGEIIFSH
jgi:hypothetical protein